MASTMSVVFSGESMDEINEGILDHVANLKAGVEADPSVAPPEKKKKRGTAKRTPAKKKAAADAELDDLLPPDEDGDDFGDVPPAEDEPAGEDGFGGDEEDLLPEEGGDDAGLEDVRDALGKLSAMGHEEVAQKILKRYGKCKDLTSLAAKNYDAVLDATNQIIAKVEAKT